MNEEAKREWLEWLSNLVEGPMIAHIILHETKKTVVKYLKREGLWYDILYYKAVMSHKYRLVK